MSLRLAREGREMLWRKKRRSEDNRSSSKGGKNLDEVDLESGLGRRTVIEETQVNSALDMAKLALASVRRRAEQSEGEAALLSVQLQDRIFQQEKERERRTKLEKDVRERTKEIDDLQNIVAESVVHNRRVEARLERAKSKLRDAQDKILKKDERIKELETEKTSVHSDLLRTKKELKEALEKAKAAAASRAGTETGPAPAPPAGEAKTKEEEDGDDVSAAALTLARALAREMSGFGKEGLETEASATASAALKLAEALGHATTATHFDAAASTGGAYPSVGMGSSPLDKGSVPVTPPMQDKENEMSAFDRLHVALSSAKANRASLTAPARSSTHQSSGALRRTSSGRRRPLSSSKKANQSPWPTPLGNTLGQFLSWTSATKSKPRAPPQQEDVENNLPIEYSLTSWQ